MKIAMVSKFLPEKDGIAIYSENLIKSLKKIKNLQIVKIGSPSSNADHRIRIDKFSLSNELQSIIAKENIDVLHFQYIAPWYGRISMNLPLIYALKNISLPKVVTLHEVQYSDDGVKNKILNYIERKIVKSAIMVVVHSHDQKKFLENKYKTKNIVCIYHGLNLLGSNKLGKKKINQKKARTILFFGIITPAKGLRHLIEAMAYLKDFKLVIAGNTPKGMEYYKKELSSLIEREKLRNVATDFRWISEKEKWEYFKKADVVVLPYLWAPYQSGVLHNAFSAGLPVVATKVGALSEIVEKFNAGEIVKPGNALEIAEGIRKVFRDYPKYRSGIMKYRKLANWDTVGKEHMTLYKKFEIQRDYHG